MDPFPRIVLTWECVNTRPGPHVHELLTPHRHVDGSMRDNPVFPGDHILYFPVGIHATIVGSKYSQIRHAVFQCTDRRSIPFAAMRDLANVYLSLGDIKPITDIRENMDERLDPVDWRFVWLDWAMNLEQGKLGELPSVIDRLPVEMTGKWWALAWKAYSYMLSGDPQKAREYWLNSEPDWDEPDQ